MKPLIHIHPYLRWFWKSRRSASMTSRHVDAQVYASHGALRELHFMTGRPTRQPDWCLRLADYHFAVGFILRMPQHLQASRLESREHTAPLGDVSRVTAGGRGNRLQHIKAATSSGIPKTSQRSAVIDSWPACEVGLNWNWSDLTVNTSEPITLLSTDQCRWCNAQKTRADTWIQIQKLT